MKKLFFVALLCICGIVPVLADDASEPGVEKLWEQGNTLYSNGDYAGAVEAYETIAGEGYVGSRLFYNLGNAYFKSNKLGLAILNYNKARKLAPYDEDIAYNLTVANGYVKDSIDAVPEFFASRWIKSWRVSLDSNAWAALSLVLLIGTIAGVMLFLLSGRRGVRKIGFFCGAVLLVAFVFAVAFAAVEKRELVDASEGIVLVQAVAVKSAPDEEGGDLFILHEGTKVDMLSSFDGWAEIMIADGNKGWVPDASVGRIAY